MRALDIDADAELTLGLFYPFFQQKAEAVSPASGRDHCTHHFPHMHGMLWMPNGYVSGKIWRVAAEIANGHGEMYQRWDAEGETV